MSTLKNFRYVARTLSGGALLAGLLLSGGCSEDDGFAADDGSGTAVNFTAGIGALRLPSPRQGWFRRIEPSPLLSLSKPFDAEVSAMRGWGISPIMAEEICHLASIDSDLSANQLSEAELVHLYHTFSLVMEDVRDGNFSPAIVHDADGPVEYAAFPLTCYEGDDYHLEHIPSISALLENYYASRDTVTRIRQKSSDLRRIVQTALERNYKKYDLQLKQLGDTEKREKYRIYGELLNTYGYELQGGEKSLRCLNYYTNEEITVPLDSQLSAKDNAKKHFDKYNKLKRTYEALTDLTKETKAEIDHLESISSALRRLHGSFYFET